MGTPPSRAPTQGQTEYDIRLQLVRGDLFVGCIYDQTRRIDALQMHWLTIQY